MKLCTIEGCSKKHEAHGLCKMHYNKAIREKQIIPQPGRGRPRVYTKEEAKEKARIEAKKRYALKKQEKPERELLIDDPRYDMLNSSRTRARNKGIPHNLDIEDISIPETCPILGIPLLKGKGVYTDNSPTLDRIIPSLGYTKGNIWVISMRANRLKQDSTVEELYLLYTKVKEKLSSMH